MTGTCLLPEGPLHACMDVRAWRMALTATVTLLQLHDLRLAAVARVGGRPQQIPLGIRAVPVWRAARRTRCIPPTPLLLRAPISPLKILLLSLLITEAPEPVFRLLPRDCLHDGLRRQPGRHLYLPWSFLKELERGRFPRRGMLPAPDAQF